MRCDGTVAASVLARVRAERPLVHNMTNLVALPLTTNALLAVGASPAAVVAAEEIADFTPGAASLVVNAGTLTAERRRALELAAELAGAHGVPWVLDPVGAGATPHRTEAARSLLRHRPRVLRANAGEVSVLAGCRPATASVRGVDAVVAADATRADAQALAIGKSTVVAMTGAVDVVTDGSTTVSIANGTVLMTRVTGLGCAASALVAAALAVERDALAAATAALAWLGVAGEVAAGRSRGPGSFAVELIDALHALDADQLTSLARIS